MSLSYNSFHHMEYIDKNGNKTSNSFSGTPISVDDEQAFMDKLGPKKIVSLEHFVCLMLKDLSAFKYLYPDMIVGCMKSISYQQHIKCVESPEAVIERCKEALSTLFPINSYTKAEV